MKGLLAWQQVMLHDSFGNNPDGGDDSATDGDIDVATSFFYAAHVWGKSADGKQDYRKLGIDLCKAIWDHDINHQTFMPLLGDWSEDDTKYLYVTRPSDFILSAFATFQTEDTERSEQWGKVLDATISTLERQLKKYPTGLISDFMKGSSIGDYEPVREEVLESVNDKALEILIAFFLLLFLVSFFIGSIQDYNWNSCRVPWRVTAYYLMTHDERVKPIMNAQAKFFGSLTQINAGYQLNGKRISDRDYSDKAFTAPVWVAMWALRHPALDRVLKQVQDLESNKGYYGDTIHMLCLLQARNPRGYDTE
ncbi:hypothetical protein BGZ81_002723 [Podila clonocystis]|nr:hypothetical protein BGZ81_002723 [Podila clonocystis]